MPTKVEDLWLGGLAQGHGREEPGKEWRDRARSDFDLRKGAGRAGNPPIFLSFLEGTKTLNNTPLKLKKNSQSLSLFPQLSITPQFIAI